MRDVCIVCLEFVLFGEVVESEIFACLFSRPTSLRPVEYVLVGNDLNIRRERSLEVDAFGS